MKTTRPTSPSNLPSRSRRGELTPALPLETLRRSGSSSREDDPGWGGIAAIGFVLVAFLLAHLGVLSEAQGGRALLLGLGAFGLWEGVGGLLRGRVLTLAKHSSRQIYAAEEPLTYLACVVVWVVMGAVFLGGGLGLSL